MITAFPGFRWLAALAAAFFGLITTAVFNPAFAEPENWAMGLVKTVTPGGQKQEQFYNEILLPVSIGITIFVLALLIWVMVAYNEKSNPEPSKTSHNTLIEVAWTVVPILILLVIAVPSFRLLKFQYTYPPKDVEIKAVGYQWQWGYEYPKHGIDFLSKMLDDKQRAEIIKAGGKAPRLLAVDNPMVIPVNKTIYVQVSAEDVLHAWAVRKLGVMMDANVGDPRVVFFKATKEGTYYGQCSELCGRDHGFMPIEVRVVNEETYNKWLAAVKSDPKKAREILRQAALDLEKRKKANSVAELKNKPSGK